MGEELKEIIKLLKKCLPIILENPRIITGCDISEEEIEDILENKQISLEVLQHVAGDRFFETYHEEVNLIEKEANEVARFLHMSAPHLLDEMKEELPYLKK